MTRTIQLRSPSAAATALTAALVMLLSLVAAPAAAAPVNFLQGPLVPAPVPVDVIEVPQRSTPAPNHFSRG